MPGIDFSKGFRNSFYDYRSKEIVVWGWDEQGARSQTRESYKPYLYVETNGSDSDATSIFNTPLRRITFESPKTRKDFITRHPTGRVFGSLGPEQQFLLDQLWVYDPAELIKQPLRVAWLDIEVNTRVHSEAKRIKIRKKSNLPADRGINTDSELQSNIPQSYPETTNADSEQINQ